MRAGRSTTLLLRPLQEPLRFPLLAQAEGLVAADAAAPPPSPTHIRPCIRSPRSTAVTTVASCLNSTRGSSRQARNGRCRRISLPRRSKSSLVRRRTSCNGSLALQGGQKGAAKCRERDLTTIGSLASTGRCAASRGWRCRSCLQNLLSAIRRGAASACHRVTQQERRLSRPPHTDDTYRSSWLLAPPCCGQVKLLADPALLQAYRAQWDLWFESLPRYVRSKKGTSDPVAVAAATRSNSTLSPAKIAAAIGHSSLPLPDESESVLRLGVHTCSKWTVLAVERAFFDSVSRALVATPLVSMGAIAVFARSLVVAYAAFYSLLGMLLALLGVMHLLGTRSPRWPAASVT